MSDFDKAFDEQEAQALRPPEPSPWEAQQERLGRENIRQFIAKMRAAGIKPLPVPPLVSSDWQRNWRGRKVLVHASTPYPELGWSAGSCQNESGGRSYVSLYILRNGDVVDLQKLGGYGSPSWFAYPDPLAEHARAIIRSGNAHWPNGQQ